MSHLENVSAGGAEDADAPTEIDNPTFEAASVEDRSLGELAPNRDQECVDERRCNGNGELATTLAAMNVNLFAIAQVLGDATRRMLGEGPATRADLEASRAGLDYTLRYAKQVTQISRLVWEMNDSTKMDRPRPAGPV